jgi:hypothetical protein
LPRAGAEAVEGWVDCENVGEEVGAGAREGEMAGDVAVGKFAIEVAKETEVLKLLPFLMGIENGDKCAFPLEFGSQVVDLGDHVGRNGNGKDQGGVLEVGGDVRGLLAVMELEFEGGGDQIFA